MVSTENIKYKHEFHIIDNQEVQICQKQSNQCKSCTAQAHTILEASHLGESGSATYQSLLPNAYTLKVTLIKQIFSSKKITSREVNTPQIKGSSRINE
jgi:hypothetical protein